MTRIVVRREIFLGSIRPLFLFILLCSFAIVSGQYYGMKFSGHEVTLDQRSGLDLTPENSLHIKENLDLQFYLRFEPGLESYFGYVFRLLVGNQNIDLIHGGLPENPNNFELILGDKTSNIAFFVPIEELTNDWIKIRFEIDFKNYLITCLVNDRVLVDNLSGIDYKEGFRLMFGAHSFGNFSSTDVPGMILRDIEVKSGNRISYRWPLNETEGSIAHSIPGGNNGAATNPGWLLKQHNTWNHQFDMNITGAVKTTFDPKNDDLYVVSKDSVLIFNIWNNSMRSIAQSAPASMESTSELLFDTISNKLVLYSLDYNYNAVFDFESMEWSPHDPGEGDLTVFWHHNRLMAPDGTLITFGGYGDFMYRNSVLAWDPEKSRFDSIAYKGDFHPRYLAGSGFNPGDSLLYIVGGYGSESGKQSESPDYYYEILSYSLENSTFSSVVEFQNIQDDFCFANSVVFDDSNNIYALRFPKYQFDNKLQLVRIPLENPEIIELADAIEYSFLDINSFADLHFSKRSNTLVAVSWYTSSGKTLVAVHTIAFPPQAFSIEATKAGKNNPYLILYFFLASVLIVFVYLLYKRRRGSKDSVREPVAVTADNMQKRNENSVFLFGGFQVIDQKGKDITSQFTPLPKKLFLFILLHSLRNDKGVSSNTLYETFWFDKSKESARNNRAVNIVKLRSLLENLDTASISKETGYWKFDFDPSRVYIDYFEFLRIVHHTSDPSREQIVDLLSIIDNRPYLINTNADWLDPFKSEISNEIIDTFLRYIGKSDDDPEFLLHLINCIFLFDTVSEEALKVQCRLLIKQGKHSLANKAYTKFIGEYRQLYNEEYKYSFAQIIEEK